MVRSKLILVDAAIDLILGILLIFFPLRLVQLLGAPMVERSFYPSILGAVLVGIGIALLIEYFRGPEGMVGLGFGGAMATDLCGAVVLAAWLVSGRLGIPIRGYVFLWVLVAILVFVSGVALIEHMKKREA